MGESKNATLNDTKENINAALLQAFIDISSDNIKTGIYAKGRKRKGSETFNITTHHLVAKPTNGMFKGYQQIISIDKLIDKI